MPLTPPREPGRSPRQTDEPAILPPRTDPGPGTQPDRADHSPLLDPGDPIGVRIGELSRRVGISTELLRAWERRYHLLQPARSPKGYRLYSEADEQRVRSMQEQLAQGLSAAEAARVARRAATSPAGHEDLGVLATVSDIRPGSGAEPRIPTSEPAETHGTPDADAAMAYYRSLQEALDAYDEASAQQVFDAMMRRLSPTTVLRDIVMPYLSDLGARWADGRVDVAQEHFASNLIRGRLGNLAVGWGDGVGPRAVLACPKGELHDLPLLVFGIVLHRNGWRVTFLGNNTPVSDLQNAVRQLRPDIVVMAATTPTGFLNTGEELKQLGELVPVVLAGAGATPEAVRATGATALPGDPVTEAQRLQVPGRPTDSADATGSTVVGDLHRSSGSAGRSASSGRR